MTFTSKSSRNLLVTLATVLFVAFSMSAVQAQLITFDDLSPGNGMYIPANYQGYTWNNFAALDSATYPYNSGYQPGTVSGTNVAYNPAGLQASLSSATQFNFNSAYLTAAWNDGLAVEVQGYNGATLVYDTTVMPSSTSATLFNFNFDNITSLNFISSGGTPNLTYDVIPATEFALDNLSLSVAPEPSTWAMLAGGLGLLAFWHFRSRSKINLET